MSIKCQKRKVRSLNWFVKNCKLHEYNGRLGIGISYEYPNKYYYFEPPEQKFCGKEIIFYPEHHSIDCGSPNRNYWEEWMFEPLERL